MKEETFMFMVSPDKLNIHCWDAASDPWSFCSNTGADCTWQLWSSGTGRPFTFPASQTYPKLLIDWGCEATAQRFQISSGASGLWEHPGHHDPSAASPMIFWIVFAVHTQLHLSGLIFSLDSAPLTEWVSERESEPAGHQRPNKPHGGVAFAAAHCLHNGEENSLTAF